MRAPNVLREILAISSGTMAALCGRRTYGEIDRVTHDFHHWTADQVANGRAGLDTWQDCWTAYNEAGAAS